MDVSAFAQHLETRRSELRALLGDLPARRTPTARTLGTDRHAGFDLHRLEFDLNGIEPVAGWMLMPHRRIERSPAMLYLHAHFGNYDVGKEELLEGRSVLPAYAPVFAEKGIVALALDSWCFSSRKRRADGREGEHDAAKLCLWRGQTLFGMMLFDELQALHWLSVRPEIDPDRIGVMGLSMGATKAWWLAALDPRVRLCVDLCCLTDFQALIDHGNLQGHGIYYYVPGLLKRFSAATINELIVPRPRLSLNGRLDALTPPEGVERIREHVLPLYRDFGREEDCRIELFVCGHEETPEMRRLVLEWLDRFL